MTQGDDFVGVTPAVVFVGLFANLEAIEVNFKLAAIEMFDTGQVVVGLGVGFVVVG